MSNSGFAHRGGGRHPSAPPASLPPGDRPRRPAPPPPPGWLRWLIPAGAVITALLLANLVFAPLARPAEPLTFTEFVTQLDAGHVAAVAVDPHGRVAGTLTDGSPFVTAVPTALGPGDLLDQLEAHHVAVTAVPPGPGWGSVILSLLPFLVLGAIAAGAGRARSGSWGWIMGVGRAQAKLFDAERPPVRFSDVAGYDGAKAEIAEVVDYLRDPARWRRAGARGPAGVLMVGPPGTGKTLLARAVAGEAAVPFLSTTGSSFVEMFVGVGAARVRDLFAEARRRAPAIIFIDEIDALGARRSAALTNDEREQTLNQLLAEMDGFDPAAGVVVLAATNRPEALDAALVRPGRFDRHLTVGLPNLAERRAILALHCRDKRLAADVDLDRVARAAPGFSGADLANLVNEAAIAALRAERDTLAAADFDAARDRIILGRREPSNILLPEEKHAVAVHESGHALVATLAEHADPVDKVTILPAGQALGVTEQLPAAERHLYFESYLRDSLAVRLGGRAAELVVFAEASTGAANDLASATDLAIRMVRDYGLSPRLGPVSYPNEGPAYLPDGPGAAGSGGRRYAEATQAAIDAQVAELLRAAQTRATQLIEAHRGALDQLVAALLEHETVDGDLVYRLLRRQAPAGAALSGAADLAGSPQTAADDHPGAGEEKQRDLFGCSSITPSKGGTTWEPKPGSVCCSAPPPASWPSWSTGSSTN